MVEVVATYTVPSADDASVAACLSAIVQDLPRLADRGARGHALRLVVPAGVDFATVSTRARNMAGLGDVLCWRGREAFVYAESLWQTPFMYTAAPTAARPPLFLPYVAESPHPERLPLPDGVLYTRRIRSMGDRVFSLRRLCKQNPPPADIALLNKWHNNPRVAKFWNETGPLEHHAAYVARVAQDAHTEILIGALDGRDFVYFEVYWLKEDHLAPHAGDVGDYDRGWHVLVGEEDMRGPHMVEGWMTSITHFLFMNDARTMRVVLEPRHDNAKLIGYLQQQAYTKRYEFDFPHKRAALMEVTRGTFFRSSGPN